jgi:hypothetical protein
LSHRTWDGDFSLRRGRARPADELHVRRFLSSVGPLATQLWSIRTRADRLDTPSRSCASKRWDCGSRHWFHTDRNQRRNSVVHRTKLAIFSRVRVPLGAGGQSQTCHDKRDPSCTPKHEAPGSREVIPRRVLFHTSPPSGCTSSPMTENSANSGRFPWFGCATVAESARPLEGLCLRN